MSSHRPTKHKPTPKMRLAVYLSAGFACQECGLRFPVPDGYDGRYALAVKSRYDHKKRRSIIYALELDHIQPYRDGGSYTHDNLQALCTGCNVRKGARV